MKIDKKDLIKIICSLSLFVSIVGLLIHGIPEVQADDSWSREYDAAQGELHKVSAESSEEGFTGDGYVAGWNEDGQSVEIAVEIPRDDIYTLVFRYSAAAGEATRSLEINNESFVDEVRFSGAGSWSDWQIVSVNRVPLEEGENIVTLTFDSSRGSRNWLNYDSLVIFDQKESELYNWGMKWEQAELAQLSLENNFWNNDTKMFNNQYSHNPSNDQFHYWWQAHAIDVLIDGYERTGDEDYILRATDLFEGVLSRNGGTIPNEFYDDMLWMALALQRLHDYTDDPAHEQAVWVLWEDIKTGWNEEYGGGIAWNKGQLDYKNTPSNASAVILAARLYEKYGNEEDLEWALTIYNWQKDTLVDPKDGFVWDGINRTGEGNIDKGWAFSYNQGVYIGAAVELYKLTGEQIYLDEAIRTAETAQEFFSNHNQILYEGGSGDGGLFKGIFVRYLTNLILVDSSQIHFSHWILHNAEKAWSMTETDKILFGSSWEGILTSPVELSQHLSGVMLMEQAAQLEAITIENILLSLSTQLNLSINDGELHHSVVNKLTNRIDQVNHHLNNGRMQQALKHLKYFEKHLEKDREKGRVSEEAYFELQEILNRLNNDQ